MRNFWKKLNKPILALAPMAGVTDLAFREMCLDGGADVFYSEMASVTALVYSPEKTLEMLKTSKREKHYVVQLFGSLPEHFEIAAKIIEKEIRPSGIDINFGCPAKKILKQGAGACLMNDLSKSRRIIEAVVHNTQLPVSIKTRTRVGDVGILDFLEYIKDIPLSALMIHGRTLKQGFAGKIDYRVIKDARKVFRGIVLANGGVFSVEDGAKMLKETGADGLGVARGAIGRPWLFNEIKNNASENKDILELKKLVFKHTSLVIKHKGKRGITELRKHLGPYFKNFGGAKELRTRLVTARTEEEIKDILEPPFPLKKP